MAFCLTESIGHSRAPELQNICSLSLFCIHSISVLLHIARWETWTLLGVLLAPPIGFGRTSKYKPNKYLFGISSKPDIMISSLQSQSFNFPNNPLLLETINLKVKGYMLKLQENLGSDSISVSEGICLVGKKHSVNGSCHQVIIVIKRRKRFEVRELCI